MTLSRLEKDLLAALVAADGADILHNTKLIDSLNKTKEQAASAAQDLEKLESLQRTLEAKASTYKGLATLGASLYFAIAALYKIDHMYRFSSTLFVSLFSSIFTASIVATGDHRAMKFESELGRVVFRHISTAMFNKHRAAAALHLMKSSYAQSVDARQYELLLNEAVGASDGPRWIPADRRPYFSAFAAQMPDLVQALKMKDPKFDDTWTNWIGQFLVISAFLKMFQHQLLKETWERLRRIFLRHVESRFHSLTA
jgi:hypothetical protein